LNSLDPFFKNVGKHNLLTREDEVQLAQAMEAGDKFARSRMVQSNLRLAISIAKRYTNKGCEFEDLVQESNVGLIKAVDRFDWRRGVKFSTYATWWIKQSVRRLVTDQSSNIKMPASANVFYYRAKMMIREYTEEFGVPPADNEVAEFMGVSLSMYATLMNSYRGTVSLDSGRNPNDSDSPSLGDIIADPNAEDAGDIIDRNKIIGVIRQALASLTPREEKILRLRFGISEQSNDHENYPITESELNELDSRFAAKEV